MVHLVDRIQILLILNDDLLEVLTLLLKLLQFLIVDVEDTDSAAPVAAFAVVGLPRLSVLL